MYEKPTPDFRITYEKYFKMSSTEHSVHFMQIVLNRENWHEMSNPVFWKNEENVITLLSAE